MTIEVCIAVDCLHCGIVVLGEREARQTKATLDALAIGHAPMCPPATCPRCLEEIPSSRIRVEDRRVDLWLANGDVR
jgi:hypothetical protein